MLAPGVPIETEVGGRHAFGMARLWARHGVDTWHSAFDQVHSHPYELPGLGVGALGGDVVGVGRDEAKPLGVVEVVGRQPGVVGRVPELPECPVRVSKIEGVPAVVRAASLSSSVVPRSFELNWVRWLSGDRYAEETTNPWPAARAASFSSSQAAAACGCIGTPSALPRSGPATGRST
jgi:hypothetical protein